MGSGGGVVAIVQPIHARIPSRTTTARNAVTSSTRRARRWSRIPYTIIPIMLPARMPPPKVLSLAISLGRVLQEPDLMFCPKFQPVAHAKQTYLEATPLRRMWHRGTTRSRIPWRGGDSGTRDRGDPSSLSLGKAVLFQTARALLRRVFSTSGYNRDHLRIRRGRNEYGDRQRRKLRVHQH
jgi:hypothetical protein